MNSKRYLPLIVLIFASLIIFVCGLVTAWFFWDGSKTLADKIQVIARWGTLFALVMVALLWAGLGMDRLFARRKKTSARSRVFLLGYVFLPILSCIGLLTVGAVVIYLVSLFPRSWNWTRLPTPPEPAAAIAAGDKSTIVIRTDSGSYFSCITYLGSECWKPVPAPEQMLTMWETEITTPPPSKPPKAAISILGVSYRGAGMGSTREAQTWYAILEDGSVWYMQRDPNTYNAGMGAGFFVIFALIPAVPGLLVIYLGAGVSVWTRSMSEQNTANKKVTDPF